MDESPVLLHSYKSTEWPKGVNQGVKRLGCLLSCFLVCPFSKGAEMKHGCRWILNSLVINRIKTIDLDFYCIINQNVHILTYCLLVACWILSWRSNNMRMYIAYIFILSQITQKVLCSLIPWQVGSEDIPFKINLKRYGLTFRFCIWNLSASFVLCCLIP